MKSLNILTYECIVTEINAFDLILRVQKIFGELNIYSLNIISISHCSLYILIGDLFIF